jgi:hypothetical protein
MNKNATMGKDILGALLFSICMTCVSAIPYCIVLMLNRPQIAVSGIPGDTLILRDSPYGLEDVLLSIAVIVVAFIFFAALGGLGTFCSRAFRGQRPSTETTSGLEGTLDETRMRIPYAQKRKSYE